MPLMIRSWSKASSPLQPPHEPPDQPSNRSCQPSTGALSDGVAAARISAAFMNNQKGNMNRKNPFVSIIICTHNRAKLLKRALKALVKQTIGQDCFELVIVDDGSRDETAHVCKDMHADFKNFIYINKGKHRSIGNVRNTGIKASSGQYIIFLDDDCISREDWAQKMIDGLKRFPIVAGAVTSPSRDLLMLCHNIGQFHSVWPGRAAGPITFPAGANMAFRRSILKELGGFNTDCIIAEDMELALRAQERGYQIIFSPEAIVIHDPKRTELKTAFKYSFKHAGVTVLLRNRFRHLLKTPIIFRSPVLILLAAPLIGVKVTFDVFWKNRGLEKFYWTVPFFFLLKVAWCLGAARGLWLQNKKRANSELKKKK